VTFRFYEDPASRLAALRGGEIDVAVDVPRTDVAELKGRGVQIAASTVGSYLALYLNRARGLLADRDLRTAVAEAIDRKGLVDGVLEGLASPSQTLVPADVLGRYAADIKGVAYDQAGAATLLDRAGW